MNNGSADMIWINGENFATLKKLSYAYGPWATKTPNAANFDFTANEIKYDFGLETSGLEMPYNEAQVVFIANEANVNHTIISDMNSLLTWIKGAGAGKFTYATPCSAINADGSPNSDPTGAVFIRHVFYSLISYESFLGSFNQALYEQYAPTLFQTLRSLEPFLYSASGLIGKSNNYPTRNEDVDNLIASNTIDVTLAYDPGHATAQIQNNVW
jgi:putative spermidine/putrescine transport system substrate-binding protein